MNQRLFDLVDKVRQNDTWAKILFMDTVELKNNDTNDYNKSRYERYE